ncbi:MAG: HD domain-containing protein [Spirochaetaceae bacterium]|nr:MAG: HD domain-containing protein [Spirochaetaceae bacterium]
MKQHFEQQLEFLSELEKLKSVIRRTYLLDSSRRENDAEHSWQVSVMAILFGEYASHKDLDMLKVLKILLLHDAVEVYAGDTYIYDTLARSTQKEREGKAADRLFALLPDNQCSEFHKLWDEYEAAQTPEAKYANAIDRFQPLWHNYMTKGKAWQEHNVAAEATHRINDKIREGSSFLWEYGRDMIVQAVKKGYLNEK